VLGLSVAGCTKEEEPPPVLSIAEARSLADGTQVTVSGFTTVAPGTFSSATGERGFAIQDDTAGVYVRTSDTLAFDLDSRVQLTGTLGEMNQLRVIDVSGVDVTPMEDTQSVTPETVTTGAVNEDVEGLLVAVRGMVSQEVQDDAPYGVKVFVDDGTGEVQVFVHLVDGVEVIDTANLAVGAEIEVVGFAAQYEDIYEVAPRIASDLVDVDLPIDENFYQVTKALEPTQLYVIPLSAMSNAEKTMIGSLQGLVSRHSDEQIYIDTDFGGYATWLNQLVSDYGVDRTDVTDPWELVDHFRPVIQGYLLYADGNDSINAATSLAGVEKALVLEESLLEAATTHELSLLMDLRDKDESWVHAEHGERLNPYVAFEQREAFENQLRDYAVLSRGFLFYDGNSALRDAVIEGLEPDGMTFGWGDASIGEDTFVGASSERGVFTVAADHAHNMAPLSGIPSEPLSQQTHATPTAEAGVHYAAFLMTDGDNVQWLLGNFQSDSRWYGSPVRGQFDMGYGIPPVLSVLAPSVMRWYYDNAGTSPGRDFFVVGPSGGGYLYPSLYPPEDLATHVERLAGWMALGDLNLVQILDSQSFESDHLWDTYTAQSQIDGLFYLEYADYSARAGALRWSNGKPVLAPRAKVWDGLANSDVASITGLLNQGARDATSPLGYSLIMVAAWGHSLEDVQAVIDGLEGDVRVVTPGDLAYLVGQNVPHEVVSAHDYTAQDFETTEMALVGDAFWATDTDELFSPHPQRLRLTSNGGGLNGSAWMTTSVDPAQSWSASLRLQISYPAGGGADGMALHIQGDGLEANPGHLGSFSAPHLSVVIDTWNNGTEGTDESLKVLHNGAQIYFNDLLDFELDPNPGSSPNVFRLELDYSALEAKLFVRLFDEGGDDALYGDVGVDLSALGASYVGFSATTGASTENHDVRTFSFAGAAPG